MATIGKLSVQIAADAAGLLSGLSQAAASVASFVNGVSSKLAGISSGSAGLGASLSSGLSSAASTAASVVSSISNGLAAVSGAAMRMAAGMAAGLNSAATVAARFITAMVAGLGLASGLASAFANKLASGIMTASGYASRLIQFLASGLGAAAGLASRATAALATGLGMAAGFAQKLANYFQEMAAKLAAVGSSIGGVGLGFVGILGSVMAINTALSMIGVSGVGGILKLAADAESARISFTVFLESIGEADDALGRLQASAATRVFGITEIRGAAQQMLAYGRDIDEVIPTLDALARLAAASGNTSAETFGRALYAINEIRNKGQALTQDLRQLATAGIPIFAILAKTMGKSVAEIHELLKAGHIDSGMVDMAIIAAGSSGKIREAYEKNLKTIGGMWSTFKTNSILALTEIGQAIVDGLDLKGVIDQFSSVMATVRENGDAIRAIFSIIGAGIKVAMTGAKVLIELVGKVLGYVVSLAKDADGNLNTFGQTVLMLAKWFSYAVVAVIAFRTVLFTITLAQKAIAAGQAIILALAGPAGWAKLAAAAAIAAIGMYGVSKAFDQVAASGQQFSQTAAQNATAMQKQALAASMLNQQLKELIKNADKNIVELETENQYAGMSSVQKKQQQHLRELEDGIAKARGTVEGMQPVDFGLSGANLRLQEAQENFQRLRATAAIGGDATGLEDAKRQVEELQALFHGLGAPSGVQALREDLTEAKKQVEELRQLVDSTRNYRGTNQSVEHYQAYERLRVAKEVLKQLQEQLKANEELSRAEQRRDRFMRAIADAERAARTEKDQELRDKIIKDTATNYEKFIDIVNEVTEAHKRGNLELDLMQKAIAKAKSELLGIKTTNAFEDFQKRVADLQRGGLGGMFLTEEQRLMGIAKAFQDLEAAAGKREKYTAPKAFQKGTAETATQVLKLRVEKDTRTPEQRIEAIQQRILVEQQRQVELGRRIAEAVEKMAKEQPQVARIL